MKIKAKFTTGISFWEKISTYVPGKGNETTWSLITVGPMSVFPCEWRGKFGYGKRGNETFSADAEGVIDWANIRMPFVPDVYQKLRTGTVVVIRGSDDDSLIDGEPNPGNPNVYEAYTGVDNIYEENQFMEFRVHRYEVMG